MLEPTEALQLILGPDRRNPSFCLYTDPAEKALPVYYGLELLEVVPNDRHSPAYRLLAARLYNAGVRVATLEGVFGLDRKTMRTWGQALCSGDREWLAAVLAGRWGRRQLTVEMASYVRARWPALQGRRDDRRRLQAELAGVFGVKVSGETLRPLLRQLRRPSPSSPGPSVGPSVGVGDPEQESAPPPAPVGRVAAPEAVAEERAAAVAAAEQMELSGVRALGPAVAPVPASAPQRALAVAAANAPGCQRPKPATPPAGPRARKRSPPWKASGLNSPRRRPKPNRRFPAWRI
jgi:hypothetical protein